MLICYFWCFVLLLQTKYYKVKKGKKKKEKASKKNLKKYLVWPNKWFSVFISF